MKMLLKFLDETVSPALRRRMLPKTRLYPIGDSRGQAFLFGTHEAKAHPFLMVADYGDFLTSAPTGYLLVGHWGHGVNSYALYYSVVDERGRVFFRLGYGGVYMDNERRKAAICQFLEEYFAWEQRNRACVRSRTFLEDETEGHCHYEIVFTDGTTRNHDRSMFRNPDFSGLLAPALGKCGGVI